jgi:hypothetical protein
MAGLVPAIHVFLLCDDQEDVDARHEAGHDGEKENRSCRIPSTRRGARCF